MSVSRALATALIVGLVLAQGAAAAPAEDRLLPVDQHTSDKARGLAGTHRQALRDLNAGIYHCLPWVELTRYSIGFYKPKHLDGDTRYLSLNVVVDQHPSPEFSRLAVQDRVSSMFSRYVPHDVTHPYRNS